MRSQAHRQPAAISDRSPLRLLGLRNTPGRRRWLLALLVTIIACAAIVMFCRPATLARAFESIGVRGAAVVLAFYGLNQLLRAIRIWIGLPSVGRPSLGKVVAIVSVHQCLNHLLPLRLGEAGFPLLIKRHSVLSAATATSVLLSVRIQEMFVLAGAFLCSLTLTVTGTHAALQTGWLVAAALGFIGLIGAFHALLPRAIGAAALLCRSKRVQGIGAGRGARLSGFFDRLQGELAVRQPVAVRAGSWLLTVTVWGCSFLISQVALNAAGLEISFVDTVFGTTVASISHVLPINAFGSFGSLEAGWTLGFTLVGLDPRSALAVGFILHLLALFFLIVTAALSWFWLESRPQHNATTHADPIGK